jgi:ketosteroid isomerase-like protein
MAEQENVQVVQGIYAAFGRGDMAAFLDALTDDVEWVIPGPSDLPFVGTFRGKAGVQEWLGKTMDNMQFRVFEPREFIAQGDKVVVLVHAEITLSRTGRDFVSSDAHVWTLRAGKVARQQSYEDTAAVADAYRGR